MIKVKNVAIQQHNKTLISELNVHFKCGEFWAILGKNGTGKSTLLETIAGFKPVHKGTITLNTKPLTSFSPLLKAQNISYLPQSIEASLNCTVEQNLSYARYPWHNSQIERQNDRRIIDSALDTMELQHLRDKNIQEISGGELRKVEIATVLVQDSDVIMLDEPLNHLDLSFRIRLMQHLKQLSKNKTIIMVTHDIQYVQKYCTNTLMIIDDKQTLIGEVRQLITQKNLTLMLGMPVPYFMTKTKL